MGFATALRLAGEGYGVVATVRNPEADGPRLVEAARAASVELNVRRLDVRDDESVRRAFEDINDLGVLVTNAGIMWFASAEETEIDRWKGLFDTNLFGAFRIALGQGAQLMGEGAKAAAQVLGAVVTLCASNNAFRSVTFDTEIGLSAPVLQRIDVDSAQQGTNFKYPRRVYVGR